MPCGFLCTFLVVEMCLYGLFVPKRVLIEKNSKVVINMTLNILFFTVTIKTRKISVEEAIHNQMVQEAYEENKNRAYSVHRLF